MAWLKTFLRSWWFISSLVVVLALAVLCLGLPLFVLSLRGFGMRVLLAGLVLLAWAAAILWRRRRARQAATALAAAITGDGEGTVVGDRLREALAQLKAMGGKRRDYLYARPWYIIFGPPGAGKTTALRASGLQFPVVDQAMKGVGGTRNLDFWFSDAAVLVDTAGRYTAQDSEAGEDAAGWRALLATLRRHRPLQPINGVLIAIGLDTLAQADPAALDTHAATVRRRLAELGDALAMDVPVYLLFTKLDLIAGAVEYFADLDVEGRRAVLGRTFSAEHGPTGPQDLAEAFDSVAQAVADRQAKRLANEADVTRRSLILGFPAQLDALRSRLVRFVDGAFPVSGAPAQGARLRGFYLTSGTQTGTPIDRLLAGMADASERPSDIGGSGGVARAYFLNRLLGEVVFPEAGLATLRAGVRRQEILRTGGAVAGVAVAALFVAALWTISFVRNRSQQASVARAATSVAQTERERGIDLVEVNANDPGLDEAVTVLDQLRALPGGAADRAAGYPPLTMRLGLWQSGLSDEAVQAYQQGLRRILLPRLLLRAEQALGAAAGDPLATYEPLKVYLMLGGQRPGGAEPAAVRRWVTADWSGSALTGADRADLRHRLAVHLDALLSAGDLDRVWAGRAAPLEPALVAAARATVQAMAPGDRAYAILRNANATQGADWQAGRVLSSADGNAFAEGPVVLAASVPYFFTREGYARAYRPALVAIPEQVRRDAWVFGSDAASQSVQAQLGAVRQAVASRYAQDYSAAWDKVVSVLKPGRLFDDTAAFGTFTKAPSPFALMLREVRRNTTFDTNGAGAAVSGVLAGRIGGAIGSGVVDAASGGGDAGAMIAQHFAELNAYVGDGKAPSALDGLIDAVRAGGQAVLAAKASGATGGAGLQDALSQANAAILVKAQQAPPALKAVAGDLAQGGASAQSTVAQGNLRDAYASSVLPACRAATQDKYPFFAAATADAGVGETVQHFGSGGTMAAFVDQRLHPLLDTGGPVWRWRGDDPAAASFDPSSADALAKTAQIRDLLVSGQPFKVQLIELGAGADAVEFAAAGTASRFDTATRDQRQYQWSLQGGLPEAHVTLFKGGQKIDEVGAEGPWAVFRLFDKARRRNDGQTAFQATFGGGDRSATLRIILPSDRNPFSRGGMWTFRCPVAL